MNIPTTCTAPTAAANSANCETPGPDPSDPDVDDLTNVGSFTGSPSPYGTFDQGGNVWEWNETMFGSVRMRRGGSFNFNPENLAAALRDFDIPANGVDYLGFRVAMIPECGTGVLVTAGLFALAGWRTARA